MLETKTMFAPIKQDMPKVKEVLDGIADVEHQPLAELLRYIMDLGGKRIRPALTLLAGKFHDYDLTRLVPMAAAIEALHTATLVHDDVIDVAFLRRGNPTLNSLWNSSTAVLVGDYLFAKSADLVAKVRNHRVNELFAQTLMEICSGELRQVFSAFRTEQTREEYFRKIRAKTASLFSAAMRSGAILSSAPEPDIQALTTYGSSLGIAFQIVDDVLDFVGDEDKLGKPVGNDLRHGTLTLPALLFLERYPNDNRVRRVLENPGVEAYTYEAIMTIRNSEAIDESYKIAEQFCATARASLSSFPKTEHHECLLDLADYVIERRH